MPSTPRRSAAARRPGFARTGADGLHRILVATDGSPGGTAAVELAADLAVQHGAQLLVAHVAPLFDLVALADDEAPGAPHEPTARERGMLSEAAARARERGASASTELLAGPPAEAIATHAQAVDADLVVVGSRGHGALASTLLGSVSLGVLQRTRQAVVIVRAPRR